MENIEEPNFSELMNQLIRGSDAQEKSRAAVALTKATIADHGFLAFYKYLTGTFADEIQAIELFCRIILSKPRAFADFRSYLLAMRQNFHEFLCFIINDDVMFDSFVTKLFYSMRMHNLTSDFDFFYSDFDDRWLCCIFCKLCSKQFYFDELREVYCKNYASILNSFNRHRNIESVECGFRNLDLPISFWSKIFSDEKNRDIFQFLLSYNNSKLPQSLAEAMLVVLLFKNTHFPEVTSLLGQIEYFSPEFSSVISSEIDSGKEANLDVLKSFSQKTSSLAHLIPSQQSWVESIIEDLSSAEPAVIAHGLYALRKESSSLKREQLSSNIDKVAEVCSPCLFHEDTYVFMNAIRLFHELSCPAEIKSFSTHLLAKYKKSTSSASSNYPRLVEVFSLWIGRKALPAAAIPAFLDISLPMLKDEQEECRISSLNALSVICTASPSVLTSKVHQSIFGHLTIDDLDISSANLETQALFSFIDSFLSSGTVVSINPDILGSISELCRRALKSPDSSVKSMALNNLMKLENLRRF